ncbi:MAG: hypothetical protein IJQ01_06180 [Selenomonadaceae bacterium]|nr:hypothetical protein [Selenomonadaceae bacterium]
MRLHKVTNALVIDLDKLSGLRLENLEYPDRFRVYLLVDGHEYFMATFSDREKRKKFVDKLIKVWGNDESRVDDGTAASD